MHLYLQLLFDVLHLNNIASFSFLNKNESKRRTIFEPPGIKVFFLKNEIFIFENLYL